MHYLHVGQCIPVPRQSRTAPNSVVDANAGSNGSGAYVNLAMKD